MITFEFAFILFFGLFAILVYGPYNSLEHLISDRLQLLGNIVFDQLGVPLLLIAFFRFSRLAQELIVSGVMKKIIKQPLHLDGGSWMLLLFLWVMAAPLIARSGPNPVGGLMILVLLKMLGGTVFGLGGAAEIFQTHKKDNISLIFYH